MKLSVKPNQPHEIEKELKRQIMDKLIISIRCNEAPKVILKTYRIEVFRKPDEKEIKKLREAYSELYKVQRELLSMTVRSIYCSIEYQSSEIL